MDMLGRYRIEGRIGEGAMADVFRAHDPSIGRTVAIKVLKPDFRRDPELGARFVREARAAGALSHAHIATIYDVGEADSVPYIAMELVEGKPLDDVLAAQGRMPYERVLLLGAQMASALGYAHAQGIVHRDVKPSNILLSADGKTAKLLDFGVARVGEVDHLARTQAGQMIGTPRYMSPEQALGMPVDRRSDLFSLGVVLYEMVTGKVAFDAPGMATLAIQIAQEKVAPIDRTAADCPPGLRAIIDKLLAKKPEARFADATALHDALQRELMAVTVDRPVARRGLSIRVKLPLVLVALTAVALFASISPILSRQQRTLEHMAITSGASIAGFVTSNAAVLAADNAGLPAEQQDWAPLQAFVTSAARDQGIRDVVVADASGVIRAASDPARVGQHYAPPANERALDSTERTAVTAVDTGSAPGLRFVRPIRYAGADFGTVDLVVRRAALDAAIDGARWLLFALAAIVMGVVLVIGYLSGSLVARPLRRLQRALADARTSDFALRIAHRNRDEFGAAFDAFNQLADAVEPRLAGITAPDPAGLLATRVESAPRLAA
jgi:eukaryotic-like serine/threonine-protein kinase